MKRIADFFGYGGTMFSIGHIIPLNIDPMELGKATNQALGTVIAILTIIYWIRKLKEKRKK